MSLAPKVSFFFITTPTKTNERAKENLWVQLPPSKDSQDTPSVLAARLLRWARPSPTLHTWVPGHSNPRTKSGEHCQSRACWKSLSVPGSVPHFSP